MDDSIVIRSEREINYCPKCGSETEEHEFTVRESVMPEASGKTNIETKCPNHGTIILQ